MAIALPTDPDRELAELKEYLGSAYDEGTLRNHTRAVEAELDGAADEATLYRTSNAYLYDLTVFAMSGTKLPYLRTLASAAPPGARVLDYGCGIGSDGLRLLDAGYRVSFADFDNPSTRYLRWRLERRGAEAPLYDLDRDTLPTDFDLAYSFDVIEHVDDPFAFLGRMEAHARLVLVNFLDPEPGETSLHHALPVRALVDHAAARDLRSYRVYHRRSHLVLYDREPANGVAAMRSRARARAGRARAALRRRA